MPVATGISKPLASSAVTSTAKMLVTALPALPNSHHPPRIAKHRYPSAGGHDLSSLRRGTFLFDAMKRIHPLHMVSLFLGGIPGVTDNSDVQRDQHADSRCHGCDRLDHLKPLRQYGCSW
jgi:hypothetical protein